MGMGRLRIWRSGSRITGFRRRENWWGRSVPLDLPGRADSARNLGCDVAGKRFLQNGATRFEVRLAGSAVFTKRSHAESGDASREDGIRCFTKRTHRSLSALSPPQSERPTGARNVEYVVLQNEPTQPHARSAGPSRVEGFARQYSDFNLFGPGATLPMKMGDPRVERTHWWREVAV